MSASCAHLSTEHPVVSYWGYLHHGGSIYSTEIVQHCKLELPFWRATCQPFTIIIAYYTPGAVLSTLH